MKRKPIRLAAAVAAIVVAGLAVVLLAGGGASAGTLDTHHGNVKFAKGQERKILNEVDGAAADTPPDALVAKGRQMFRDPALFQGGETCQTCHAEGSASPGLGTMTHDQQAETAPEGGALVAGMKDFNGPRDAPALWGLAKTAPYFWDGSIRSLSAAILRPVRGHMKLFVSGDCSGSDGNSDACNQEAADRVAALTAYVKTLDPPSTAFDEGRLSADAKAGEKLFQGKGGCIECHGGPLFTDNLIHNTGVPQVKFTSPYRPGDGQIQSLDLGAPPPPADAACAGATPPAGCDVPKTTPGLPCPAVNQVFLGRCSGFVNTPQMRDLKNTAPYMHNGAFATLKDVVDFYNTSSSLSPLNLTPAEVQQLVAYLDSL
jgi:cytochrome c peroxidase